MVKFALARITPSYRYLSRHLFAPLFGCIGYISGAHKKSRRLLWMSRTWRICWQDSISGDWFLCLGRAAEKWVAWSNRPRVRRCLPLPRKANRFREIRGVGGPQPRHQIRTRHTLRDADFPFIQPLMDHGSISKANHVWLIKGSHHIILNGSGVSHDPKFPKTKGFFPKQIKFMFGFSPKRGSGQSKHCTTDPGYLVYNLKYLFNYIKFVFNLTGGVLNITITIYQ